MSDQDNQYTLVEPVELGGVTYETLTVREPRAHELERAWHVNQMTMSIKLLAIVCGVPEKAIRMMSQTDLGGASDLLANFQSSSPKTGET